MKPFSVYLNERANFSRALLEVIAVRLATHRDAIEDYIQRTLLYHTTDRGILRVMVEDTIQSLCAAELITINKEESYEATSLGQAAVASSLSPEDAVFIYHDFRRALQAFVMDGEMHVFYMFTPIQSSGLGDINWPIFRREMDGLDESGLRALKYVGVNPAMVNRMYAEILLYVQHELIVHQKGEQLQSAPRKYHAGNRDGQDLSSFLRSVPAPGSVQRSSHPRGGSSIRGTTRVRPEPRSDVRRVRRGHDQVLRAHGLGHAPQRSRAHERSTEGRSEG